jgi:hypothetical protein
MASARPLMKWSTMSALPGCEAWLCRNKEIRGDRHAIGGPCVGPEHYR